MDASPGPATLTFLFTDIEGSTKLWEHHPDAMRDALARHDDLLRTAIEAHGGQVFKTVGDAFCAAFVSPTSALAATLAAQRALSCAGWPETGPIRVRMALHTGEALARDADYFGPTLNRVARLLSAGYGGQTLLSQATYDGLREHLPAGVEVRDLGRRRLKDLVRPEQVYQVIAPDLPADFPPLKTLDMRPNNLPAQTTRLIGRDEDVRAVGGLLTRLGARLVTLTGPGGAGKTRLALHVGAELVDVFDDGVHFVPLASVRAPDLVMAMIAQTLGIREAGQSQLAEIVVEELRSKHLLLVLDNFEQIASAAPTVADLLAAAPRLSVLVTSRAPLRLRGEFEYPVSPLEVPDRKPWPAAGELLEKVRSAPAVQLFVERASAVKPDFRLARMNAHAVSEICRRLDGLPLAIELAAARIRLMSPQQMLDRLDQRLKLLTGGSRDLPARHQTLRRTIEGSYELLSSAEQALFRRLAVFEDGFDLEAAEAICDDAALDLDTATGLEALVEQNLLRPWVVGEDEAAPRFAMLETIREFAVEELDASDDTQLTRGRHADYYLSWVEQIEPELWGAEQAWWLQRVDEEYGNLRAVLEWSHREGPREVGLRLAAAVWWFWYSRGHLSEGRARLETVLKNPGTLDQTPIWAKAVGGLGGLAWGQGDYAEARACYERILPVYRSVGDRQRVAGALVNLGLVMSEEGDYDAAGRVLTECLEIFRTGGDRYRVGYALANLGLVALAQGDYAAAARLHTESLEIKRALSDTQGIADELRNLAIVAREQGDYAAAAHLCAESVDQYRTLGDKRGLAFTWSDQGWLAYRQREYRVARELVAEALGIFMELGNKRGVVQCVERLAALAQVGGDAERATTLAAAADKLRRSIGAPLPPAERVDYDATLSAARQHLDTTDYTRAWTAGVAMPLSDVTAYALASTAMA